MEVWDVLADAEVVAMVAAAVVAAVVVEVAVDVEAAVAAVVAEAAAAAAVVALVAAVGLESDFEVFLKPVEGKKKAFLGSSGSTGEIRGKWHNTKL